VARQNQRVRNSCHWQPATCNWRGAFTLLELLVVISILGIITSLSVPALKNLGKSNARASATRQLLDDLNRARQLAISQRTTVYMVFVPTNFFNLPCVLNTVSYPDLLTGLNNIPLAADRQDALIALTNAVEKQLTGYFYVSYGRVGDQPGQHKWRFLTEGSSLPDGNFIAAAKFLPQNDSTPISEWQASYAGQLDNWLGTPQIYGFSRAAVPFPTEESPLVLMPCLAFDFMGRLVSEVDAVGGYHHAYIPLAQGTVSYGMNINKQPQPTTVAPNNITENPPGGSSSISFNVIDVTPLTGRASSQKYKMP
jgi:prepilin-type N-terminal cleavage/methylation domain-containing protein